MSFGPCHVIEPIAIALLRNLIFSKTLLYLDRCDMPCCYGARQEALEQRYLVSFIVIIVMHENKQVRCSYGVLLA